MIDDDHIFAAGDIVIYQSMMNPKEWAAWCVIDVTRFAYRTLNLCSHHNNLCKTRLFNISKDAHTESYSNRIVIFSNEV